TSSTSSLLTHPSKQNDRCAHQQLISQLQQPTRSPLASDAPLPNPASLLECLTATHPAAAAERAPPGRCRPTRPWLRMLHCQPQPHSPNASPPHTQQPARSGLRPAAAGAPLAREARKGVRPDTNSPCGLFVPAERHRPPAD